MSKLYFKVASDWQEVVRLRTEVDRLEKQLRSMDANKAPQAVAVLNKQIIESKQQLRGMVDEAAKAGAVMEKDFKSKIFQGSKAVNDLSEKIIKQKGVVKDVEADVRRLANAYKAVRNNPLKASNALSELNSARNVLNEEKASLFGLQQEQSKAKLSVKKLRDEYALYKDDSRHVVDANGGMAISFGKALGAVGGAAAISGFMHQLTSVRGMFQKYEAVLANAFDGDKVKAKDTMSEIGVFAAKTNFQLDELTDNFIKLVNRGVTPTMETFGKLGDFANTTAKPMAQLNEAILDINNPERWKEFGVQVSTQGDRVNLTFRGITIQAERSVDSVMKAIEQFGSMKGVAGSTAAIAGTIEGQLSNLEDTITTVFNKIGENSEGFISESISLTSDLISNYETIGKILGGLIATYGAYRTAIIVCNLVEKIGASIKLESALAGHALTTSQGLAALATKQLTAAQLMLNKAMLANPYVLAATAIVGLCAAMWAFRDSSTEAERAQERFNKKQEESAKIEQEHKQKIDELLTSSRDLALADLQRGQSLAELRKEYPKIFEKYDIETIKLADILKLKQQINAEDNLRARVKGKVDFTLLEKEIEKYEQLVKANPNGNGGYIKKLKELRADRDLMLEKRGESISEQFLSSIKKVKTSDLQHYIDVLNGKISNLGDNAKVKMKLPIDVKGTLSEEAIFDVKDIKNLIHSTESTKKSRINANKNKTSYKQDLEKAKDNWEKAKKVLLEIEKDKDKFTSKQYQKAKDDVDSTEKLYKDLGGVTKEHKPDIDRNRKDQAKLAEEIKKSAQEQKDLMIQSELDTRQQQIDLLDEGSEKELAQIQLNYDRKYQEIVKRERELLQKMQDEERKQWEKDNPKFKEKNLQFTSTIKSLTPEQRSQYDKEYSLAFQKQEKDTQALLNKLLEKYRDYEAQKAAIEKEGNTEIAYLQSKRTDANAEEIDRAIAVAKQKIKEGIQQIDDTRAEATAKDNPFLRNLFGDTSQMAFKDLQNLIDQAKQLRSYLSGTGDSKGITFIDAEQLKAIEKSPAELDKLKKALDNLLKGSKSNEWDDILKGFDKGLAKIKSAKGSKEFSEGMQDIGESASKASDMISGVSGDLSSMFEAMGNTEAADAMSGVQDAMNAISNIGQGFAKGGIVGGIAAAVGEAANFIGKAFAANARHKAALKEIMNETIAQQREYNLLLMQQNLEYEKAVTIFGTDAYSKAANGVDVMREAISDLNDELRGTYQQRNNQSRDAFFKKFFGVNDPHAELKKAYAGLAEIEIKTGHKKTGLFGWGKGKDVYSSILDVYPQLIDSSGKFDKNLAETIIKTRTMSDESKNALQNMIDLAQQAEDAYKELKDYMTDIFGDLGNSMTDALVNAFVNGTDAAQAFTDSVSNMLETLAKQMVYSVTLAPLMEKAQSQMMEVMKNTGLSDEQKFNKWAGILNSLVGDAVDQQELANRLMKEYQQAAKDKGFDILNSSSSSSSSSSKSGTMQMTQDEGRELNGRFTAMQIAGEEIKAQNVIQSKHFETLVAATYEHIAISSEIRNIADDLRDIQAKSYLELVEIRDNTGETVKQLKSVNERLGKIESNTNGL